MGDLVNEAAMLIKKYQICLLTLIWQLLQKKILKHILINLLYIYTSTYTQQRD